MNRRLSGIDWLKAPETVAVVDALGSANCRFVGGAVRDSLLDRPVTDVDLATTLEPEEVMRRLQAANLKAVPTGLAHGTVTAVSGGRGFEVTTLRHDVETFGRHAQVAFHSDWEADAARRDFTINAIYAEIDGTLHDYFGGEADLNEGRVRFIGDAAQRITEDALRILRFFRMHAWFGRGAPDEDGLAACRAAVAKLDILSVERVRDELLKLLAAPDPVPTLTIMKDAGILQHALPESMGLSSVASLQQLVELEDALARPSALRRLAALLARQGEVLKGVGKRLRLSNADATRLALMAANASDPGTLSQADIRRVIYLRGRQTFEDRLMLDARPEDVAVVRGHLEIAKAFRVPAMPVRGADLLKLGIADGPGMGRQLKALEAAWIDSDFSLGKGDLLALVKKT